MMTVRSVGHLGVDVRAAGVETEPIAERRQPVDRLSLSAWLSTGRWPPTPRYPGSSTSERLLCSLARTGQAGAGDPRFQGTRSPVPVVRASAYGAECLNLCIPGTKIPVLRLLGLVVSIGLADSLNPSTIGPAMYLSTEPHPRRTVLQFTAGVFVVFFLGGAVLTIGPGQALLRLIPHPGPTVTYVAETVVGVAMLIASLVLWRLRRRPGHRKSSKSSESSESRPRARSPFVLGVTTAAVELLTAVPTSPRSVRSSPPASTSSTS